MPLSRKRLGYGRDLLAPHSLTMTMIGASLLWVGWFGFNAGSNLEANGTTALAMINTFVATAAAALSWLFVEWGAKGKPSLLGLVSGAIAGLVAVTPASGFAGPMGSIILGLVAGALCYLFVSNVKNALGYDDSLDVFGIHCIGGISAPSRPAPGHPALGGAEPGLHSKPANSRSPITTWPRDVGAGEGGAFTLAWSGFGSVTSTVRDMNVASVPQDEEREASTPDTASAPTITNLLRNVQARSPDRGFLSPGSSCRYPPLTPSVDAAHTADTDLPPSLSTMVSSPAERRKMAQLRRCVQLGVIGTRDGIRSGGFFYLQQPAVDEPSAIERVEGHLAQLSAPPAGCRLDV